MDELKQAIDSIADRTPTPPNREMLRLRDMLDERGIEHFDYDANKQEGKPILETQWHTEDVHATYVEYPNKGNTTRLVVAWHPTPEQAIAATVGNGTDLSKRLREVTGLRSFAELFGFSWTDGSDWDWHDVACAMADEVDATVGEGMTLDQATEYAERFMGDYAKVLLASTLYVERDEPTDQHAFNMAESAETKLTRTLAEALATAGVGTCRNVSTTGNFRCSECDAADLDFDKPTYCHGCGRRVVDE